MTGTLQFTKKRVKVILRKEEEEDDEDKESNQSESSFYPPRATIRVIKYLTNLGTEAYIIYV